jgi:hypothetical protein
MKLQGDDCPSQKDTGSELFYNIVLHYLSLLEFSKLPQHTEGLILQLNISLLLHDENLIPLVSK